MSHYFHTHAITLFRRDFREDDRLMSFYTQEYGKINAIAAGAKKFKSKLSSHMEPFGMMTLGLVRGKRIYRVTSAQSCERYDIITQDLDLAYSAGYCVRFFYGLVREGVADKKLFTLLRSALATLNAFEKKENLKIFNAVFTLQAMSLLGYRPEFSKCLLCKSEVQADGCIFSTRRGGLLCHKCFQKHEREGISLKDEDVRLLRQSLEAPFPDVFRMDADSHSQKVFNTLVTHFLQFHLL